ELTSADVPSRVADDRVVSIDDSVEGRIGNQTSANAVSRAGDIEQDFWKHAHREPTRELGELFGELVGSRNVGRDLVTPADEKLAEGPEPGALPAHFNLIVERLHAKQDHELSSPSPRLQHSTGFER